MRGYAGQLQQEWSRVSGIDVVDAERELSDALESPAAPNATSAVSETKRIDPEMTDEQKLDQARQIIGVKPDAPFAEIRKVYERLMKRCDAANFADGSIEAAQAATIRRRVEWAYSIISERLGSSEKRFGSLEID